jgi:hypothetical protein
MRCLTGKIGYPTAELARTAMSFSQLKGAKGEKKPIRVFHCEMCDRWHMTSQEKKAK